MKGSQPAYVSEVRIQSYCYFRMSALKSTMQVGVRSRFEFAAADPKADTAATAVFKFSLPELLTVAGYSVRSVNACLCKL